MWKVFFSTFGLVFLAELGDKTQLATMLLATQSNSPLVVFMGAAAALVLSSFFGVLAGSFIARFISPQYLQTGAGVGFVLMGILLLSGKF